MTCLKEAMEQVIRGLQEGGIDPSKKPATRRTPNQQKVEYERLLQDLSLLNQWLQNMSESISQDGSACKTPDTVFHLQILNSSFRRAAAAAAKRPAPKADECPGQQQQQQQPDAKGKGNECMAIQYYMKDAQGKATMVEAGSTLPGSKGSPMHLTSSQTDLFCLPLSQDRDEIEPPPKRVPVQKASNEDLGQRSAEKVPSVLSVNSRETIQTVKSATSKDEKIASTHSIAKTPSFRDEKVPSTQSIAKIVPIRDDTVLSNHSVARVQKTDGSNCLFSNQDNHTAMHFGD